MSAYREFVDRHFDEMLADLKAFVELESPTTVKAATDRAARHLAGRFADATGAEIVWHAQREWGDHFEARVGRGRRRILLLGHVDTVWPLGTIERLPCRIDGGRITGPGSFDMKSGDIQALWALRAVVEHRAGADKTFVFFGNTEEEVGSPTSRPIIESLARDSECVLVLEPSVGAEGAVKLWRKGVGMFRLDVEGVASHAGADPEKGRSAVLELAHQIVDLYAAVPRAEAGTTLNAGVIQGGTRSNVVAAAAEARIDLRVRTAAEARRAEAAILNRPTFVAGTTVRASGGLNRPPMEETPASRRLYEIARRIAADDGFELPAGGTGGGSDGNFTAAIGVPTLDGLGAVGDGGHAETEHVRRETVAPRTAWFARLLAEL
ncbi:MAG TPA: M20 family metallopeptidase [bacterium]|nr:M20 family metallopeptidase [bacterium]